MTGITVESEGHSTDVARRRASLGCRSATCAQPRPAPPDEIVAAARSLRYRALCLVALIIDDEQPFPDNWIYLHDPGTVAGRVQNFGAWSPDMVKPGTTCLGVEYFCFEDDEIWLMSDEEAVALATDEMARIGLVDSADVVDGVKVRVPKAYPMYDPYYREAVALIHGYLAGFENLKTCGRNGLHRYNNQDHSMWTAILATLNLLDGTDHDVWAVNTEAEYHEEGESWTSCSTSSSSADQSLSIVVASNGAPGSVEACLASLAGQVDGAEVIVRASSPGASRPGQPRAPGCARAGALARRHRRRDGAIVALTISPMRPAPDWVARSASGWPDDEVVAGAIEPGEGLRIVDWAEYFCRYARDMLPFERAREPGDPGRQRAPTGESCSSARAMCIVTASGSRR